MTGETETDNNQKSVTVTLEEAPSGSIYDMYVGDIDFDDRARGKKHTDYRVVIDIRHDSDANGVGELSDDGRAGLQVTVDFAGNTYTGVTDEDGIFRTEWIKNLGSGEHQAEVTDLAFTDYSWNMDLDLEDDSDGDGLPDDELVVD